MPKGDSTQAFCYRGNVIPLDRWKKSLECEKLIEEATDILHNKLLYKEELPEIKVEHIFDDLSNNAQYYSFTNDPKNTDNLAGCVNIGAKLQKFAPGQSTQYLAYVHDFLNILQIVILYSGGVAPSTEDLVTMHLVNGETGPNSPLRSVRVYADSLWLLTSVFDQDLVLRRLPKAVGLLLLFYLIIVRRYLIRQSLASDSGSLGEDILLTSPYVFPREEYDTLVRKQTLKDFGVEMSYMEWREVYIFVERSLRPQTIDERGLDPTNTPFARFIGGAR